jgi:hypothetical protein
VNDAPTEPEGENPWVRLCRRKVVQWGLAHAAAPWTLLQVIEYFGETYSLPPTIRQIDARRADAGLVRLLGEAAAQSESDREAIAGSEVTAIDSSGRSGKGENRP